MFVETEEGVQYLFDLKTNKPNKGDFRNLNKHSRMGWNSVYTKNKAKVHTLIAIPYNPYEPNHINFDNGRYVRHR